MNIRMIGFDLDGTLLNTMSWMANICITAVI